MLLSTHGKNDVVDFQGLFDLIFAEADSSAAIAFSYNASAWKPYYLYIEFHCGS